MPNERARNKRPHVIFFYLYEIARKDKVIETGSISVVALGLPVGAGIDQKQVAGNFFGRYKCSKAG